MYGTIARMQVLPGHEAELNAMGETFQQDRAGQVDGFVVSYLLTPDKGGDERLLFAIFRDREAYWKNAEDPAQDAFYQKMRAHLAADPEWTDGEIQQLNAG
jgi:hypothetical protein